MTYGKLLNFSEPQFLHLWTLQHVVWQASYQAPGMYAWIWVVSDVWESSLCGRIGGLGSIHLWCCTRCYTRERQTRISRVRKVGAMSSTWENGMRLRRGKGENWVKMLFTNPLLLCCLKRAHVPVNRKEHCKKVREPFRKSFYKMIALCSSLLPTVTSEFKIILVFWNLT